MDLNQTMQFKAPRDKSTANEILMSVYYSMKEKGYDPINQIVGYLISGDPTYITSFNNARYLIRLLERDELMEELALSMGSPRQDYWNGLPFLSTMRYC